MRSDPIFGPRETLKTRFITSLPWRKKVKKLVSGNSRVGLRVLQRFFFFLAECYVFLIRITAFLSVS